jgi:hypothetical protein
MSRVPFDRQKRNGPELERAAQCGRVTSSGPSALDEPIETVEG